MANVIFSHGKESGPEGRKIKELAKVAETLGHQTRSIDYRAIQSPDDRVGLLLDRVSDLKGELILVGSSMGGYVSLVASHFVGTQGLFLLAPAISIPGYNVQEHQSPPKQTEIVHGWSDSVIPIENSIQFARTHNANLHLIKGDHRLTDSLELVRIIFETFLSRMAEK